MIGFKIIRDRDELIEIERNQYEYFTCLSPYPLLFSYHVHHLPFSQPLPVLSHFPKNDIKFHTKILEISGDKT